MVEGYVDDQGQATVEIEVGESRGEMVLNAIVDTGFSRMSHCLLRLLFNWVLMRWWRRVAVGICSFRLR